MDALLPLCRLVAGWWWWCNGVGDVFLAHFRPLSANWASFKCHGLIIVSDHVHPFMATMYPSSDGYFQQDNAPCHKAPSNARCDAMGQHF